MINSVRPSGGQDVSGTRLRVLVVVVVLVCGTTLRGYDDDLEVVVSALAAFAAIGLATARELGFGAYRGEAA